MSFVRAIRESELREKGRAIFRHGGKQVAIFALGDAVHAVDNRCPHEGYPLLQGSVAPERALLTCQWHNWKFDLTTGDCILGEDHVRRYPTRVVDNHVEIDLSDPPVETTESEILRGLEAAIQDRQYGRIAREISRLVLQGLDPLVAVSKAIDLTWDRFEFGTTHAYAALADWLSLYERETDVDRKVVCLTEALDHVSDDALRQPIYPYSGDVRSFDGDGLLAAIEAENEALAVSFVRGAIEEGLEWRELERWFCRAAFAHYADFGHAAIYVLKTGSLLERLPGVDPRKLLLPLTRMIGYSTREDQLPDFRPYVEAAAGAEATGAGEAGEGWLDGSPLSGMNVKEALAWTREGLARHEPLVLYSALLEAGAVNLLRFDESFQRASYRSVSQAVGWLDFTHTITFGNALRELASRHPEIWPRGLLQMACFVGRNKRFLLPAPESVEGPEEVLAMAHEAVLDHGLSEPIFSAHLVKTLLAVEREAPRVSPACARQLRAALGRFFSARIKEKHPLRTARQALGLVANR
jgi:nitrite reductase/ring-hydroxylating ferredoxin subunit